MEKSTVYRNWVGPSPIKQSVDLTNSSPKTSLRPGAVFIRIAQHLREAASQCSAGHGRHSTKFSAKTLCHERNRCLAARVVTAVGCRGASPRLWQGLMFGGGGGGGGLRGAWGGKVGS